MVDAWNQLLDAWNLPGRPDEMKNVTFAEFAWDMFQQDTNGLGCDTSDNSICRNVVKCLNETTPLPQAGYLILNSLVFLNTLFYEISSSMDSAQQAMSGETLVLAEKFAPSADTKSTETASIVFGFMETALGLVSAGSLSSAFNALRFLGTTTEKTIETLKSTAEAGIGFAAAALEALPPPTTSEEMGTMLQTALGEFYTTAKDSLKMTLKIVMGATGDDT
ncbi:uncharacterized protein BDZ99DRAFT_524434 [Mytilinidion resinicola]|uniref:Uncharacterized protein n=1 Tax=Mytilinidion resinicola TaxID=574789 RepID=A0A6A6YAA5_9PEZI|nr:uncharacterized protein BDZ99DRAFT_524434 [Mytilinidion resinicola]KAF2805463.1 hypothetical protein BDZ99DRAFT_524434 [Mytilinidion resinicola]